MASLEQVEKLREKANVSFEEAKAALEANNDDILEAIIYLEKQGRVNPPVGGGYYSSSGKESKGRPGGDCGQSYYNERRGESFGEMLRRFGRFCAKVINKGNNNFFEAEKNGNVIISCPVTALVLLLIFFFWVIVPLIIIGLFFGFRYHFRGLELGKESINKVMDSASSTAEEIKRSISGENK